MLKTSSKQARPGGDEGRKDLFMTTKKQYKDFP